MISCLILGGGINGLLSALMLRQAGQEVSVLERNTTGRESSWAGAGVLSLLPPWNYGPEVNALAKLGRALWPELAEHLRLAGGVDPEYLRRGMLVLEPEQRELALDWCEQQGETVATLPASLARFHALDSLWLPNVAQARNPRIMQALRLAATRAGVRIHEHTPATQLLIDNTRVVGVATPGGVVVADNVLVTAGAWSGGLLAPLAHAPDIAPVRGQIVLLKAEPGVLPCVIYRRGHYLVPRADGLILVGSTLEEVGFDHSTTARARTELLDFAYGVMPELRQAQIITQWSGLRPGAPDNIPTIGRHPSLENLYLNSGHFRYGVTMAPAAVEVLSHHMTGTTTTVDVAPYAWRAH